MRKIEDEKRNVLMSWSNFCGHYLEIDQKNLIRIRFQSQTHVHNKKVLLSLKPDKKCDKNMHKISE